MSYDLDLVDPNTGNVLTSEEKHNITGGTYTVGGTTMLSFNITYNYSPILINVLGQQGIRTLYEKTGKESIPILEKAIALLNDDEHIDYWKATEGNVKKALQGCLELANMGPTGIWKGD